MSTFTPTPSLHLNETASQTGGPYVHIGLAPLQAGFEIFENNFGNVLAGPDAAGQRIAIEGQVIDGSGTPMRDVLVEIWQADAAGHYAHPADPQPSGLRGWGRTGADFETGLYRFETIKPGRVPARNGASGLPPAASRPPAEGAEPALGRPGAGLLQAPHINFWIVARGINVGLHTRLYFGDEAQANEQDPVLRSIEWAVRRKTLVAEPQQRGGLTVYRFDVVVQSGDPARETVFFDF